MRKLLFALVLLLGVVFIFFNIAEVEQIANTLRQGDWRFIVFAVAIEFVWLLNLSASFFVIYRAIGLDEGLSNLFIQVSAANFVNVVAPSGGMGGITIFISEGRKKGYSSARVTVAGVLVVLFEYLGFLCVLTLGLIVLFRRNHLSLGELIPSAILFSVACVLATVLYLGMRSSRALGSALAWMSRLVNRLLWPFVHRPYIEEHKAYTFAEDAGAGLKELRQKPRNLVPPLLLALSNKSLLICILWLMFLAFRVPYSIGTLVAGFSIGYLFFIVSPTPAGLGFVEGALTLGLRSLNVSLGAATVLTLAYRGVTFWVPFFFGMIAFRWLTHRGESTEAMVP